MARIVQICINAGPIWLVVLFGAALRLVHLLSDNYFVSSADSYYFYHYADCINNDTAPLFRIEPGLSYPVGYLAKVLGLEASAILVPVLLGAVITVFLYFSTKALFNQKIGLGAAFMWAAIPQAYWITGAGYLDRDGLTVGILAIAGVLTILIVHRGGRWPLVMPILFTVCAAALVYSWSWIGGAIVAALVTGLLLISYRGIDRYYFVSIEMMLILLAGCFLLWGDHLDDVSRIASQTKYDIPIAETKSMRAIDIMLYWHPILIMAVCLGVWVLARRIGGAHSRAVIIWLVVAICAALVIKRLSILALPPVCLAGGAGLALAYDALKAMHIKMQSRLLIGIGCFIGALVLGTFTWHAYVIGTVDRLNPSPEWQEALEFLQEETPPNSKILCSGDYGYWILALADREPLAYGGPVSNIEAVAGIYCAETPGTALAATRAAGADYFIYATEDYNGPIYRELSRFCSCQDVAIENRELYKMARDNPSDLFFYNGEIAILKSESVNTMLDR